jgi:hypothetical protein
MTMFGACQWLPDEPAAGAISVEADAGPTVDVTGAGGELKAEAGAADLVGRKSAPFCPQPASSATTHDNSKAETTMRRRMHAIRSGESPMSIKARFGGRSRDGPSVARRSVNGRLWTERQVVICR